MVVKVLPMALQIRVPGLTAARIVAAQSGPAQAALGYHLELESIAAAKTCVEASVIYGMASEAKAKATEMRMNGIFAKTETPFDDETLAAHDSGGKGDALKLLSERIFQALPIGHFDAVAAACSAAYS